MTTYATETPCGEKNVYSFSTTVECATEEDSKDEPTTVELIDDGCTLNVTFKNHEGCAEASPLGIIEFTENYPWVFGLVLLIGGPIIALLGKRWFPYITASIASIFSFGTLIFFFSVFGWLSSAVGLVFSLILAIGASVAAGWFTFTITWFSIGVLGVIGGFFVGSLIAAFFDAAFGLNQLWFLIIVSLGSAVAGGFFAFKYGKEVVTISTAGIGSYAFMRGVSMFFGGFPSEAEMYYGMAQGIPLDFTWGFWLYLALFGGSFAASAWWQFKKESEHKTIEDYYTRA